MDLLMNDLALHMHGVELSDTKLLCHSVVNRLPTSSTIMERHFIPMPIYNRGATTPVVTPEAEMSIKYT